MKTITNEYLDKYLANVFKKRDDDSSKHDYGLSLIIGGSKNFVGAPSFSISSLGLTSMKVGSGMSAILVPDTILDSVRPKVTYSSIYSCESKDGYMIFDEKILSKLVPKSTSISIGMGMGDGEADKIVRYILDNSKSSIIVDADALYKCKDFDFKNRAILTPHFGEFAKMISKSFEDVEKDQINLATKYAKEHNCVLVLKSHNSIVTDGERVYINKTGNAKLSKGGSGDILSGIICGIESYAKDLFISAVCGSYILGRCAELSKVNEFSCLAEDIISMIPSTIDEIISKFTL